MVRQIAALNIANIAFVAAIAAAALLVVGSVASAQGQIVESPYPNGRTPSPSGDGLNPDPFFRSQIRIFAFCAPGLTEARPNTATTLDASWDTGCDLKNPNFALMAQAMGVKGFRVEKPQELKSAIQAALAHKRLALVDVVSARHELAMPPKTTLDQAYHFGMFTMKTVLDGRAKELIDLAKTNLSR